MKVYQPKLAIGFSMKKQKRHSPEQVVKKLRDADAMLAGAKGVKSPFATLWVYSGLHQAAYKIF